MFATDSKILLAVMNGIVYFWVACSINRNLRGWERVFGLLRACPWVGVARGMHGDEKEKEMLSDRKDEWNNIRNALKASGVNHQTAAFAWAAFAAGIASEVHARDLAERRSSAAAEADKFLIEEFLPRFH